MKKIFFLMALVISSSSYAQQQTYAEKLGFPSGAKVLILHVDDAGMSWDSNEGAKRALTEGVASSVSVMMPCPWVPGFVKFLKASPKVDAGLHLTLTSEWNEYRWGPLSGKKNVPGLVDTEGAMWSSVENTVLHSNADEIEQEILSQLDRARTIGFEPTHLDSHMGTLFAKPEFLQRYIKVGISNQIPVMFPGGHNSMIAEQNKIDEATLKQFQATGKMIWEGGLPVLDDLHNRSYGWSFTGTPKSKSELQNFVTKQYIESIRQLKPGLTMVIMHCTLPTEVFSKISDSGNVREGDLLAMTNPALKKFIEQEKIIITTWREVMERRKKVK
jgi:hypothetical protein